ncbi:MAG: VTT domain-containing protein [Pseudomonadales bacterium]|nr:VTT domain-containing protein [Pseudomonadales bacterium]
MNKQQVSEQPQIGWLRWLRYLLLVSIALAVAGVFYYDLVSYLTVEAMQGYKDQLGGWAPLVFLLAFVVGELLQLPSVLWILFAGLIWPWWLAVPISLLSAMSAATVAFVVARYFLGAKFHEKLPTRLKALNQRINAAPLRAVIVIRLTTFLHPLVHWALAASSVKLLTFLAGTFIGILPATIAIVFLGQQFVDLWDEYSYPIIAVAAIALLVVGLLSRKKRSKI